MCFLVCCCSQECVFSSIYDGVGGIKIPHRVLHRLCLTKGRLLLTYCREKASHLSGCAHRAAAAIAAAAVSCCNDSFPSSAAAAWNACLNNDACLRTHACM
jgi:hypothetical protein